MLIPKPGSIQAPTHQNPRELFIFAQTKTGKTSLIEGLENHLLIDTENGSEFVSGTKINLLNLAQEQGKSPVELMMQVAEEIRMVNEKKGSKVYDYIVIDTVTFLESIAKELAAEMYKSTPMGKAWKGEDITTLPMGAGYGYVRMAFNKLLNPFKTLPAKALIMFGHVKNASINKEGKDLSAKDINLTGALKTIVAAESDAIGYMFRDKGSNQNIISFKTHEQDLASGARPPHLRGQEFVISEMTEDGKIKTHWDKIFLPEK
jgi:hypothetical protein